MPLLALIAVAVVLIFVLMMFGPIGVGLIAFVVSLGMGLIAGVMLCGLVLVAGLYVICAGFCAAWALVSPASFRRYWAAIGGPQARAAEIRALRGRY